MQDAVLIYLMLVNMRHSAYFVSLAGCLRRLKAKYLRAAAAIAGNLGERASAAVLPMRPERRSARVGTRAAACAPGTFHACPAIDLTTQLEWLQALTRLENYIASAA